MEMQMHWTKEYELGLEEVDVQHRRFLDLVREAFALAQLQPLPAKFADLLQELRRYARYHFISEEALMKAFEYPGLAGHEKEHEALFRELEERTAHFQAGSGSPEDLLFFLMKWFVRHTTWEDRKMADFIRKVRYPSIPA